MKTKGESSKEKRRSESDSSKDESLTLKRKKSKKRKRKSSTSSDSDPRSKKHKVKKHKKNDKKEKRKKKDKKDKEFVGPEIPEELLEKSKRMAPMTEEEWLKKESVIQRVYDPETGRSRLIKGSGEVLEEIVSKDMHKQINKLATKEDGEFFQAMLAKKQ